MDTVIHIGIDVHKDSYSLCSFNFSAHQSFGQTRIASKSSLVIKYVNRLQKEHPECKVLCGYEAGPTGYGLYRDLEKADIPCVVMARIRQLNPLSGPEFLLQGFDEKIHSLFYKGAVQY